VLGYNYRMTDLQAAVGRVQLRRLPGLVEERRMRADRYRSLLAQIPGVSAPREPEWARSNWQSFAVRLTGGQHQRAIMQAMLDRGVATRRGVMCAHRQPPYKGTAVLRESEAAEDCVLLLPLFPGMTDADQALVVGALTVALATALAEVPPSTFSSSSPIGPSRLSTQSHAGVSR
jgi:dTDP-4-amino-4,6-dideoxygalactose transaminase